jgi:ketosteroid isomerase-like protein
VAVVTAERLKEVWAAQDLDAFLALLDPGVRWVGVPEPGVEVPECRNRDEVREVLEGWLSQGNGADPEIVGVNGDRIVVDVRPDPPVEELELHHVYVVSGGLIVRMEDYPDRRSACQAAGL